MAERCKNKNTTKDRKGREKGHLSLKKEVVSKGEIQYKGQCKLQYSEKVLINRFDR